MRGNFLARILHQLTTAAADTSGLTALCSVGLLAVLHKYDCGDLGLNEPCQAGVPTASLRMLVLSAGWPGISYTHSSREAIATPGY